MEEGIDLLEARAQILGSDQVFPTRVLGNVAIGNFGFQFGKRFDAYPSCSIASPGTCSRRSNSRSTK